MKKSRGRGSKPGKGEDAAHGRPGPKAGGIVPTRDSGSGKHGESAGLLRMLEALKPHDHLCLIYESAEEWRAAAVPFIAIGLKRGDKCLYIVDTSTVAEIRKYLGEEGIDVASAEKSGQLSVLHQTEAYTREGSFDPDGVIALLIAETEKAVAEGYPAFRVTGEMTWVLRGHPDSEKVLEYEAKLNSDLFPHYPCLAICQYDRWKFDPQVIKGVVMTHPLLIKGNHVYHNFYYIPPEEFLSERRAEAEVQHWLNNLQRQQRARESLWESEERYRTLFERTANPVLVIDADGNYVDGNKAALQFLECTPEELRAKNVRDAIPPRQESVMDEHTPLWKTGGAIETEYYVGGNVKTLYLTITPGTWWGKEVVFGIGVGTDVTERKRAENELRESNVRFDQLARHSRTFAWEVDAEGLYTYVSHIAEEVIGYRPDEIAGRMHFYDLHPEEGREEFKEAAFEVFKRKEPFENLENLIQTRDGRIVWVSTNGIPMMDADGTLRGYRGSDTDITERKRAEEELRKSEERYRQLTENAGEAILVVQDGVVKFANPKGAELSGYTSEELASRPFADFIHPDDSHMVADRYLRRLRGEQVPETYDFRMKRKDGTIRWGELNAVSITWEDRPAVLCLMSDITERRRVEEAQRLRARWAAASLELLQFPWNSETELMACAVATLVELTESRLCFVGLVDSEETTMSGQVWSQHAMQECAAAGGIAVQFDVAQGGLWTAPIKQHQAIIVNDYAAAHPLKKGYPASHVLLTRFLGVPVIREGRAVLVAGLANKVEGYSEKEVSETILFLEGLWGVLKRKRGEEALRESKELYDQLAEQSRTIAWEVDAAGLYTYISPMVEEITGYHPDEIVGKMHFYDLHPEEEREAFKAAAFDVFKQKVSFVNLDNTLATRDGHVVWVTTCASPLIDADGTLLGYRGSDRDITERKQAEEALRVSEHNFRDSIEGSPLGVRIVTEEGKSLYVNRAMLDMCGYGTPDELLAVPQKQLHTPESYAEHRKRVSMRKRGERVPDDHEISIVRKDGQVRHLWVTRKEVLWNGETRFQTVYQDITERKRAEAARQEAERSYRILAENTTDVVSIFDLDLKLLWVSPSAVRQTGYTAEELLNLPVDRTMTPESMERGMEEFARAKRLYEEGKEFADTFTLEGEVRRKDGSTFWSENRYRLIRDEDGNPAYILMQGRDITERRKAEETLKETEERYRALFDRSSDLIYVHDFEGNLLDANEAMLRLTGFERDDIPGLSLASLLDKGQLREAFDRMQELRETGTRSDTREYTVRCKDGSFVEIEATTSVVYREGKLYAVQGVGRDLTERRRMEEQLILTDRLASIGQLASGIAHELNNPLTSVIGFSELLLSRGLPEDVKEDLEIIRSEAVRTSEVVKGLLTFARKQGTEKTLVDINAVVQQVLQLRAYEQRVNNIAVDARLSSDLPPVVGNKPQMQQVFINIIINAEQALIEAHGRGKLTITTELIGDAVRTSIADDGPGISPDIMSRLFTPFVTTKEVGKGTGLGLSICHGIVTEHGGRLHAESKPGEGATFVVELPVSKR